MRAAVLVEPKKFEIQDVPMPEPEDEEALIQIDRTGICGTDVHIFNGHYAKDKLPMVPGHEFTGKVVESQRGRLEAGQPVVVDMNIGCQKCYWCRRNEILNCPEMQQIGITMDGAFAEYIIVPERLVIPAPQSIPPEILALTEPLSCVARAAKKSQVGLGQSVVVIGAGPIGNLHVQLLRTIGAAPVIVSDVNENRLKLAKQCGADCAVTPDKLEETVKKCTDGRGADVVIESVGKTQTYGEAKKLIRKGGHIAAFGLTGEGETMSLDILRTILEENSIQGSVAGMGQDMHDALTMLAHGRINTKPFVGACFGLDEIQTAFDTIEERTQDLKTQIVMH